MRGGGAGPIADHDRSEEGRGRTALVTGASSGIGRSMATLLAAKGYDVVPVARRTDRLEALAGELASRFAVTATPLAADLGDPSTPVRMVEELARRGTRVAFLVNNAGYSLGGDYADSEWDEQERFLRVLALSVLELTHRLLPPMVERRWGRIVNVASISALATCSPQAVLYCASKSMIHKFSEGLAAENEGRGVHCTASMPGFTATEIFEASGWGGNIESSSVVRALTMTPESVAREAYDAVMAGRRSVVHGWHHKAIGFAWLHSPPALRRRLCSFTADLPLERKEQACSMPR